ncbi:MAG TPA: penicillin-binding protein 2 [Streptosporangiaceae bacterium]|nr:penicillin-binding protein 2 [Streptosporangiaceae bacterium]
MRGGQGDGRDSRPRPRGGGRPPAATGPRRPGAARRAREGGPGWPERAQRSGPDRRPPGERGFRGGPAASGGLPGGWPGGRRGTQPGGRLRGPVPPPGAALNRTPPRRASLTRGNPSRRLRITMMCIGFVLSLVAGRLVQLQAMEGASYQALAERFRLSTIPVPAVRGSITTADGTTLAMTVQTDLVYADPPMITEGKSSLRAVASALAGPLGMTPAAILAKLSTPTSPDYVVLKQSVPATVAARISALNEPGIVMKPSYTRAYPNGDLAANIIGFTNSNSAGDLIGEAGIEESYNSLLAGRDGEQEVQAGTNGQPIPVADQTSRAVVPGRNVRLTILAGLQWEAEQACAERVKQTDASSCTVVVMQPGTGQILAMAQTPSFDPAHVTSLAAATDMPVSDVFDPGSTAKVITAAAALEHGGQTPMSAYTVPDQIVVDGFTFHDADYHPTERLTIAGIIAHSSNVGMVQVVQHVRPQVQYDYYKSFGIGQPSGLGLPATSNGILYPTSKWWGDERYTMAFGQGVAVTAVQMASVYATIANGGVRVQPSIVAGATNASGRFVPAPRPPSHRVIQARTASQLMGILQQVPWLDATLGAEPWGEIPGYSVASKTGTAQLADPKKGGCLCLYGSSYVGIAPASSPKLVVAVNVQNPRKGGYYGNEVAGPVFYKVMKFALATLKIPPDGAKRPNVRLTAP